MPLPTPLFFFVINPISGGRKKHEWEAAIRNFFAQKAIRTEFYVLSSADDSSSITHYLETIQPQQVIAVGGDGTLTFIASILLKLNLNIPLGILPAGSANGMAAELGIPPVVEEALLTIENGKTISVDVVRINDSRNCLHLSDVGINAEMIKFFDRHPRRGMINYVRFFIKALWHKKKYKVKLLMENKAIYRHAYMVVIANATKYGTGAVINPDGNISDGMFEVIVLRKLSISELIKMILKKKTLNPAKTEIFSTSNVELETDAPINFQIDGEYLGKVKSLYAEALPSAVNIIVP